MQIACPQCSQRFVLDDAKVPDRPFGVKCPKCQNVVRLPGRTGAAEPVAVPEPETASSAVTAAMRAHMTERLRKELSRGDLSRGQVLVALADRELGEALTRPLVALGFSVDWLDNPDEGGRLLEQGDYGVVVADRSTVVPGRNETLFARLGRLSPDARRRIFVVAVGPEFKTGDGVAAFAATADLAVNPADAAEVEAALLSAMAERARLQQPFLDARRRMEGEGS